jgi:hypothetical protein
LARVAHVDDLDQIVDLRAASARAGSISATITRTPCPPNASAMARPMPAPPPVTSAIFPSRLSMTFPQEIHLRWLIASAKTAREFKAFWRVYARRASK